MNQEFVLFDHLSSLLTDFRPERVGKWNKADPSYVPQYCAFFLLLADEKIEQTRGSDDVSIFSLFSSWGASTFFFYVVFAVLSSRWNHSRFNAQVRGLDLRDLASEQFDAFGRLVSFFKALPPKSSVGLTLDLGVVLGFPFGEEQ